MDISNRGAQVRFIQVNAHHARGTSAVLAGKFAGAERGTGDCANPGTLDIQGPSNGTIQQEQQGYIGHQGAPLRLMIEVIYVLCVLQNSCHEIWCSSGHLSPSGYFPGNGEASPAEM